MHIAAAKGDIDAIQLLLRAYVSEALYRLADVLVQAPVQVALAGTPAADGAPTISQRLCSSC